MLLRSIDARSDPAARFLLVREGFPAPQQGRIDRWMRSHPRFSVAPLPNGRDWSEWLAGYRYRIEDGRADGGGSDPLAESLSRFLARNAPASAPFVWSPTFGPGSHPPN